MRKVDVVGRQPLTMPLVHPDECVLDPTGEASVLNSGAVSRLASNRSLRRRSLKVFNASSIARCSYSSAVAAISSSNPIALSKLAATRLAKLSPRKVSTGRPPHKVSTAVVWATGEDQTDLPTLWSLRCALLRRLDTQVTFEPRAHESRACCSHSRNCKHSVMMHAKQ